MSHSLSSDDEPTEEFDCEFGCMPMDHGLMVEHKLGQNVPPEVAERQLKSYNAMIHRETGGSDPLVQEPGP